MQRSRLPVMVALVAFCLTLVSGAYTYNRLFRTVPALVVVQDVPQGAELSADLVRVVRLPAGGRPDQALFGPGQVAGMYAAVPLFADELLTGRHITAAQPARDALAEIGKGQRIVSVPVKPEAVLGGALRPGDLVDVTVAWPAHDGKPAVVETLVTNIRVIDLRNAAATSAVRPQDTADAESAVPTSVLLLIDTASAKSLVTAVESNAAVYLWLAGRERR